MPPYICMPHTSIHPHMSVLLPYSPVHLCVLPIPYVPHMSGRLQGHLYTPYILGSLRDVSTSVRHFSVLVHPFASQFITVMPVAPHYYGLHLYWTGCLWMSAMLHTVIPFFVVIIMSQASTSMAMTTTRDCCIFWYVISSLNSYHAPLDGASSNIRSA